MRTSIINSEVNTSSTNNNWQYRNQAKPANSGSRRRRGGTSGKGTRKSQRLTKLALLEEGLLKVSTKNRESGSAEAVVCLAVKEVYYVALPTAMLQQEQKKVIVKTSTDHTRIYLSWDGKDWEKGEGGVGEKKLLNVLRRERGQKDLALPTHKLKRVKQTGMNSERFDLVYYLRFVSSLIMSRVSFFNNHESVHRLRYFDSSDSTNSSGSSCIGSETAN